MATNKSHPLIRSKESLSGDPGTRILLTTDRHTLQSSRVSPIRSLNFVPVGIHAESLATNRFDSISDEHSLDPTDGPDSLREGRIFTAASGLHCHSDLKSDEDMETRSSSRELEDSSQDSYSGASRLNEIADMTQSSVSSNPSNSPGILPSKTYANASHCRLRTVLLTSTSRPSALRMAPLETLNCPSPKSQACEDVLRSKDSDSYRRKSPGFTGGQLRLSTTVKDAIHSISPSKSLFIQSNDQTTVIPSSVSPLSLSRPPSASSYVMRRMSTDSTIDLRPVSKLTKSISEPQSPEFHPRRNTLPVSPCRLPMKKRKLNWSQLDSDVLLPSPSTPRELVHPASAPCSSFDFSFLNVPKTSTTSNTAMSSSHSLTSTEPSSPSCSSGPSPLIIDCPTKSVPRSINVAHHKKNAMLASVRAAPLCSVSPRVDKRPRSIPALLNSPLIPVGTLAQRKLEKNVFSSANNIPLSSDSSCNSFDSTRRAALTSNVKNKDCSKRPSLLIRSVPTISDPTHMTVACDISNSGLMSSRMEVDDIVSNSSTVADTQTGYPASRAEASFVHSRHDLMLPRGGYDILRPDGQRLSKNLSAHSSVPMVMCSEQDKPLLLVTTHSSVLGVNNTSTSSSLNQNLAAYSTTQLLSDLQQRIASGDSSSDLPQLIGRWLETYEKVGSPVTSAPGSTVTSPAVTSSIPTTRPVSSVSICPPASSSDGVTQNAQIIMMLSPSNVTSHNESFKLSTTDVQSSKKIGTVASSNTKITNFPLFLVSASSSAGAAALAAATARATGAPPSSFVPVPVKITSYVPSSKDANGTASSAHSIGPSNTETVHHPLSGAPEQRIVISLCTTNHNSNELPAVERKSSSLSSDSPFFVASLDKSLLDSSTLNRNTGPKSFGIPLSHPPTAVAHPSA